MKKYSEKYKSVVISGYYGFDNFGDEAILGVLVDKLEKMSLEINVLSRNPDKTSSMYKVNAIPSFKFIRVFSEIKNCDFLISGGGSLLQDVTSLKSLLYYLWVINTALFFKKKVIIFAQGIGPIKSKIGEFLTKMVLKKCDLVTVRDEKSLFLLRGWGIGSNVNLVCDPLFDVSLVGSEPLNKVGVQLRDFKTLKENLLVKLAEHINKEFSTKEIEIYSFQDSLDLAVCKRFEKILKSINPLISTTIVYNQTPKEILEKLSKLEYLIAMRFHANLIGIKYGIKTLSICYDEKVEKLAAEAHIPFVSMLADENYDYHFNVLKNLDKRELIAFSNTKHFDWSKIEKIIKE